MAAGHSMGGPATHLATPANPSSAPGTHIDSGARIAPAPSAKPALDPVGATHMRPENQARSGGHTVIRHAGRPGAPVGGGRRLVGFLVTYNRTPNGRAYNIYEGRNFIGRDASCDISIPDDDQMSGKHMSILYRNADDKFKFRDEQSSNGTFVNKELLDDGELANYDIIRAGSTIFIFIAVPKIS